MPPKKEWNSGDLGVITCVENPCHVADKHSTIHCQQDGSIPSSTSFIIPCVTIDGKLIDATVGTKKFKGIFRVSCMPKFIRKYAPDAVNITPIETLIMVKTVFTDPCILAEVGNNIKLKGQLIFKRTGSRITLSCFYCYRYFPKYISPFSKILYVMDNAIIEINKVDITEDSNRLIVRDVNLGNQAKTCADTHIFCVIEEIMDIAGKDINGRSEGEVSIELLDTRGIASIILTATGDPLCLNLYEPDKEKELALPEKKAHKEKAETKAE